MGKHIKAENKRLKQLNKPSVNDAIKHIKRLCQLWNEYFSFERKFNLEKINID